MFEDNPLLSEIMHKLDALRETVSQPARLARPFEPPPWPRAEMEMMYRFIAGDAGLPELCRDKRCRRFGHCHGGLGEDGSEACAPMWDHADSAAHLLACAALIQAWKSEVRRLAERADMLGVDVADADDAPGGAALH